MAKKVIAVDIDEVLFPLAPGFLPFYNARSGTDYRLDDMTSYYFHHTTGESEEEVHAKLQAYMETPAYTAGKPLAGALEAIASLARQFRLVVITSRHSYFQGSTEEFLHEHFGDSIEKVYYTRPADDTTTTAASKAAICAEAGAFALVDDSLNNVADCAARGIDSVLFGNYPWNRAEALPRGVSRCNDWPAVLEYFEGRDA